MITFPRHTFLAAAALMCLCVPAATYATPRSSAPSQSSATESYGMTPILWAAYAGKLDWLKALISEGADVNSRDSFNRTALMVAAKRGNADCVKALIVAGAQVNTKGNDGYTALLFAAKTGKANCVKILIAARAKVNARGNDGETALTLAADRPDIVAILQAAGASDENVLMPMPTGSLVLGSSAVVKLSPKQRLAQTALVQAAEAGDLNQVKTLAASGANVNAQNKFGQPLLGWAAATGNSDLAKALLDAGADKEETDLAGRTPLILAATDDHADIVKMLLDAGANKEASVPVYTSFTTTWDSSSFMPGETFNGTARHNNTISIALTQPVAGGPIYASESGVMDQTALIAAAQFGHADVVKLLLDAGAHTTTDNLLFVGTVGPTDGGAKIPAIAKSGASALTAAKQGNYQDVIALLTAPPAAQ